MPGHLTAYMEIPEATLERRHDTKRYKKYHSQYMSYLNILLPAQNGVSLRIVNHPRFIAWNICVWVHGDFRKTERVRLCYWLKTDFESGSSFLFALWNEMVTTYYTLGEGLSRNDSCICSISRRSIRLSSIAFTSRPCVAVPWVYSDAGHVTLYLCWQSWNITERERQCMYNVTWRRVYDTIAVVEKKYYIFQCV